MAGQPQYSACRTLRLARCLLRSEHCERAGDSPFRRGPLKPCTYPSGREVAPGSRGTTNHPSKEQPDGGFPGPTSMQRHVDLSRSNCAR